MLVDMELGLALGLGQYADGEDFFVSPLWRGSLGF